MSARDAKNITTIEKIEPKQEPIDEQIEQKEDPKHAERKAAYERKQAEMLERCKRCMKNGQPSTERCTYHCDNGKRLRWLEAEYSDVTGWSHQNWRNGAK